ncbi:MAG: hypothetical protein P8R04_00090, partial [Gammaproteobacteria bacterium]|nr:hypothetical protein [Gammaproteobacteria bacterium]
MVRFCAFLACFAMYFRRPFSGLKPLSILFILVTSLYWIGLGGPYIFDDGPALTGNAYLKIDGTELDAWRTASLSSDSGPLRRPLAMLSFAINYVSSDGLTNFSVKLVNLGIHLGCGSLVYLLALVVLRRGVPGLNPASAGRIALLATALWLLAPLHVSTVLYAVQRMAQLATLFTLAGLCLFAYRRDSWAEQGASLGDFFATSLWLMLLLLLAVLSKENGIVLVWLLTVLEITLFRGQWAGQKFYWLNLLGWSAFLAPLALVGLILVVAPEKLLGGYDGRDFTLVERLLTQLRLLWQYLSWMVFPDVNSMGFQHDDIPLSRSWFEPLSTIIAMAAWLTALLLGILLRNTLPIFGFSLLFYLTGHFFESGLWPLEMVYEHRNYLPSVGVFIFLAYMFFSLINRQSAVRIGIPILSVVALSATLLFLRTSVWAESFRLSYVNVKNHPESSRSHYFLAQQLLREYTDLHQNVGNDEEAHNYLILARHEFELMHVANERDFAALVMLYYLDEH